MNLLDLAVKVTCDDQASSKVDNLSNSLKGKLVTASKVAVGAVAAIGTAVAAVSTAFVKSVGDVAAYGDNIDKMSQKMGMSTTAYQEWDAVLQHSGTSIETMKASMKTLANAAETNNSAFAKLGITQEELKTLNQEELFARTIEGLQNVSSDTERTYLAGQLLGRGATELGALLNTSAEDTQKMKDRVHELGGVMEYDAVKAAAAYQDSLQDLRTAGSGLIRNMTSQFLPSFTTIMDGLTEVFIGNDEKGLNGIRTGVNSLVDQLATTLPQFADRAGQIISTISSAIVENLPVLMQSGTNIVMNLIQGIVEMLPQLLVSAVQIVTTIAQSIVENAPTLINALVNALTSMINTISEWLPNVVEATIKIIKAVLSALIDNLPQILDSVVNLLVTVVGTLIEYSPQILGMVIELMVQLLAKVGEYLLRIILSVGDWVGSMVGEAARVGSEFLRNVVNFFSQLPGRIAGFLSSVIGNIANWVVNMASKAMEMGSRFLQAVSNGFVSVFNFFASVPSRILSSLGNIGSYLVSAGYNLIVGFINGITSAIGGAIRAVTNGIGSVISSAKRVLGIASPSKVFAEIGNYTMQGLEEGIEKSADAPVKAMQDVIDNMNASADIKTSVSMNNTSAAGESIGKMFSFNVEINNTGEAKDAGRTIAESLYREMQRMELNYA